METTAEADSLAAATAAALSLPAAGVAAVCRLLGEGATVAFISRYRKDSTGNLDETAVRAIEKEMQRQKSLDERRRFVTDALSQAGCLTGDIVRRIADADSMAVLDDIYAPYRPRRRTRATIAREKGYEPLAKRIMAGSALGHVDSDALDGASDIIAEWAADSSRLRSMLRGRLWRFGTLSSAPAKGREAELAVSPFAGYASFEAPLRRLASHQVLALRRAKAQGLLRLTVGLPDRQAFSLALAEAFVPARVQGENRRIAFAAVADAFGRLLMPAAETEIHAQLKEQADAQAIDVFASNLRQLLMAPPMKGRRVLALDPGFRNGCKVAALDACGNVLAHCVVYPFGKEEAAGRYLKKLISDNSLDVIALGNGTASAETADFLKRQGIVPATPVEVVSESGASVYSASEVAVEELPELDVTIRGAVSIGRRLIDPLAELVKIDPKAIGVGQYQHDVDQGSLADSLDYTVGSCVNAVGVDLNTASERLLTYVSGIGPVLARNIVAYRRANGPFANRRALRKVPRLGDKAFEQAAGFLRIPESDNPLDRTGIHPESYPVVAAIAARAGTDTATLAANPQLASGIDAAALAAEGLGGNATITDILAELSRPGRDPRQETAETFSPEITSFGQLSVGMVLKGKVENIAAFGAFVDLGIHHSGLIHISRLGRRVKSVGEVLRLGQIVDVRVEAIENERRRISLALEYSKP